MVSVIVRRNSVDSTVEADTVEELYARVAEHFQVSDPSQIRLVHRGRIINRTDNMADLHIENGSVVLMTISSPAPPPSANNTQNQDTRATQNIPGIPGGGPDIGNLVSNLLRGLGGATATVVVRDGNATAVSGSIPVAQPTMPATGNASQTVDGVPLASAAGSQSRRPIPAFTLPRSYAPPQTAPPIAGVYLHVHCNLDELDTVPERLERMQRRLPNVSMQTHYPGQPGGIFPRPRSGTSSTPNAPAQTSAQAAERSRPNDTQPHPTPQRHEDPNVPPTPDRTHRTSANGEEENVEQEEEHSYSRRADLISRVISSVPPMQFLPLLSGNWASLYTLRGTIRSLREEYGNDWSIEGAADELYAAIFESPAAIQIISEEGNAGYPYEQILRSWIRRGVEKICEMDVDMDTSSWGSMLREHVVRALGGVSHFASRWLSGLEPLVRMISVAFEDTVESMPSLAPFLPMMRNMLTSSLATNLQAWGNEYRDHLQQEGDEVLFQLNEPQGRPPLRQGSLDDLVNSLLNSESDDENEIHSTTQDNTDDPEVGIPLVQQWATETGSDAGMEPLRQVLRVETHNITLPNDGSLPEALLNILSSAISRELNE